MKCKFCGSERVATATRTVHEWDPDPEPFESGVKEDIDEIEAEVEVGLHYCVNCGRIDDVWFEYIEDRPDLEETACRALRR